MNVVNKLNLKPNIDKDKLFKRLNIIEGTEAFKSADCIYEELIELLGTIMQLKALYVVTESLDIARIVDYNKFILCFVSSKDEINDVINEMMSNGEYLKGYLLNEMSTYAIFNASNEINEIIKLQVCKSGYALSKRYAAGDDGIHLKNQDIILNELKRHVSLNVSINHEHVLIPMKSLLYFYGLSENKSVTDHTKSEDCSNCVNINCSYREIR